MISCSEKWLVYRETSKQDANSQPVQMDNQLILMVVIEFYLSEKHIFQLIFLQNKNCETVFFSLLEWFVNGKPLPSGSRYKSTYDFGYVSLDINHAYAEDSGIYMCKATNSKGNASTSGSLRCHGMLFILFHIIIFLSFC